MSCLPEEQPDLPSLQQGLGQREDLHFAPKPSWKELEILEC